MNTHGDGQKEKPNYTWHNTEILPATAASMLFPVVANESCWHKLLLHTLLFTSSNSCCVQFRTYSKPIDSGYVESAREMTWKKKCRKMPCRENKATNRIHITTCQFAFFYRSWIWNRFFLLLLLLLFFHFAILLVVMVVWLCVFPVWHSCCFFPAHFFSASVE